MTQTSTPPAELCRSPTYAVVFRTHFWDAFTTRQLERVRERTGLGRLFVLVDETRGEIAGITNNDVFRLTDQQILDAGYPETGDGSIQWYSGDVPLYLFARAHPGFDYYVQLEYDVSLGLQLDDLVQRVSDEAVDMVALSIPGGSTWHWLSTMTDEYEADAVHNQLICLSVFSRHALSTLESGRLAQAARFKSGVTNKWPFCEGYVATEALKQGLKVRELSTYGDTSHYRWWPPFNENQLAVLRAFEFAHPILDHDRFKASVMKYDQKLGVLVLPWSWLHRSLRHLGFVSYCAAICSPAFLSKLRRSFKSRFGAHNLRDAGRDANVPAARATS